VCLLDLLGAPGAGAGVLLEQRRGGAPRPADQQAGVSLGAGGSRVLAGAPGALGPALQGALPAGERQRQVRGRRLFPGQP